MLYKRELAKEFGVDVQCTLFMTDNDSAVKLFSNYFSCKKSKHILRAIATLRHWVMVRVFRMLHIAGLSNWADMLTKPLPVSQHRLHRDNVLGANIQVASQRCIESGGGVKPNGFDAATKAAARFCVQTGSAVTMGDH